MDIFDPTSPCEVAGLATPGRASGIYMGGNYACMANWDGDLLTAWIGDTHA